MAVDISKFIKSDEEEVKKLIEALQNSDKKEEETDILKKTDLDKNFLEETINENNKILEEITQKNSEQGNEGLEPKTPEEIIQKQILDKKEEEIKDFSYSKIKERPSGYDLGNLETLKELIREYKIQGKPTEDLEKQLEEMLAYLKKEKIMNSTNQENQNNATYGNVDLSSLYVSGESSSLEEIREELLNIASNLLVKGILKVAEISNNIINPKSNNLNKFYTLGDNLNEENLEEVNYFNSLTALTFEKLQEEGLFVFSNEIEDKNNSLQSYYYILPKDYKGEKDYLKMSKEDIANIRDSLKNDPNKFEIYHGSTFCQEAENAFEIANNFIKSTTIKINNIISKVGEEVEDFADIFTITTNSLSKSSKEEDAHKIYGPNTQRFYNHHHDNSENKGRGQ
jgi:hypothetical protein